MARHLGGCRAIDEIGLWLLEDAGANAAGREKHHDCVHRQDQLPVRESELREPGREEPPDDQSLECDPEQCAKDLGDPLIGGPLWRDDFNFAVVLGHDLVPFWA